MLHYFGFTIQLALLRVFNVKVKNLAFDTCINNYHKCVVFYEELMCVYEQIRPYYGTFNTLHLAVSRMCLVCT